MRIYLILLLLITGTACRARQQHEYFTTYDGGAGKREMRGTWIATVANIDWPTRPGENAEEQQRDLISILDAVTANNMNCVVLQIRPTGDAFYDSEHEPWSHWLTGVQGNEPAYDPLAFAIEECDKRGIAVHVWINPYRLWLDKANITPEALARIEENHGGWIAEYGKSLYLHPADDRSRQHVTRVVADIVRRYDVDAIHMDDYFYPYRIAGQEFPDEYYFRKDPRGFTNKDEWRRDNVDRIIREIRDTVKSIKPWVEFGISPFGVWRNRSKDPRGSDTRGGQTNYDDLYADILKWEQEGWIDYVAPQLYWHIGFGLADYGTLAQWWNDNSYGTTTYIGHALYRIDPKSKDEAWRTPMEIVRQIRLNRTHPHIKGSILYSAKFLKNEEVRRTLLDNVYQHKTLLPENDRIEPIEPMPPGAPYLYTDGRNLFLNWQPEYDNRRFVVYRFPAGQEPDFGDPSGIVCVTGMSAVEMPAERGDMFDYDYYVSALSLTHHESEAVRAVKE